MDLTFNIEILEDINMNKLCILNNDNILLEYCFSYRDIFRMSDSIKELIISGTGTIIFTNNDILTLDENLISFELINMYVAYPISIDQRNQFLDEMILKISDKLI